jgi:hypothetical protein
VPRGDDHDVYLVVDDLGRIGKVWWEADYEATDFETAVTDLLDGQYKILSAFSHSTRPKATLVRHRPTSRSSCAGAAIFSRAKFYRICRNSSIDTTLSTAYSSHCRCARCDR